MSTSSPRQLAAPFAAAIALACLLIGIAAGALLFGGNDSADTAQELVTPTAATDPPPTDTADGTAAPAAPTEAPVDVDPVQPTAPTPDPVVPSTGTQGWARLSSPVDLPASKTGGGHEQTMSELGDLDGDGDLDLVVGSRLDPGPSLVWYENTDAGWQLRTIEPDVLWIGAGADLTDIDADGDLDLFVGGDFNSLQMWWFENPGNPDAARWDRHVISPFTNQDQQHDLMFGDVDGDGQDELVFWNEKPWDGEDTVFVAEIPADPRVGPWPATAVFVAPTRAEGLDLHDVDGDGIVDIVAGGSWLQRGADGLVRPEAVDPTRTLVRTVAGQLVAGGRAEIVIDSGDGIGPLVWYQWDGVQWIGTTLVEQSVYGHSLRLADMNNDGNLDIFSAEMLSPASTTDLENPDAATRIFLGDGAGGFTEVVVDTGVDNHESRVGDLDGDGDMDIFGKPYNGGDVAGVNLWLQGDDLMSAGGATAPTEPTEPAGQEMTNWDRQVVDPAQPWVSIFVLPADMDGDGDQDIVAGGWWYENPGGAQPNWNRRDLGAPLFNMATVYDFDGDGDPDVLGTAQQAVTDGPNRTMVLGINDGAGNLQTQTVLEASAGDFLQGIDVGVLSPGASTDVVLSWHEEGAGTVALSVPVDPANGLWTERQLSPVSLLEQIELHDIDGDGDLDVMLGTTWLRQEIDGTYTPVTIHQTELNPDRVVLADMDADGDLDVVIGYEAEAGATLAWYERGPDPAAPWTEHVIADLFKPQSLSVADLDGDGDADVVVGEHNTTEPTASRLFVFENTGGGLDWLPHLIHQGDEHHDGVQLVDIDGDGALDIISTGWLQNKIVVYYRR